MDIITTTWTGRNGETREYIQNVDELIGLDIDRYKTGNVRSGSLDGYAISNRDATALSNIRAYLIDGTLYVEGTSRVLTRDEIADRIVAHMTDDTEDETEEPVEAETIETIEEPATTTTYGNRRDATQAITDLTGDYADTYDIEAAADELITYDPESDRYALPASVDAIMAALDRHDVTALRAAEEAEREQAEADAAEALRADLAAAARTNAGTLTRGDLTIAPNGEYAGGGLDGAWPTSASFYVDITARDGAVTRVTSEAGSWVGLLREVVAAQESFGERVAVARRATEGELEVAARRYRAALAEVEAARVVLDPAVRAALGAGMSGYRVSQVTGLTKPMVSRIRDAD